MMETGKKSLPGEFTEKMKKLLGEEYDAFAESYEKEPVKGLRLNEEKTGGLAKEDWISRFGLKKIPWAKYGYYYDQETRPGKHPLHEAGVYYIQEPSAMAVAELLNPIPGEYILDLCAAPGGKSTQIGTRLGGQGLLVSNEIHPARAKILSQNIERMGLSNVVVTNEDSRKLTGYFKEFFHGIVVDAPCSGEGMFRKDENARSEWSPDHVILCAKRQEEILDNAAMMLQPGGRLVYSTCTFSPEENEGTMEAFLRRHPEFSIEKGPDWPWFGEGRPQWVKEEKKELKDTYRIWPHRTEGEGHYLALLRKEGKPVSPKSSAPAYVKDKNIISQYQEFCRETIKNPAYEKLADRLVLFGDQLYGMPEGMVSVSGLKVLRPGLHLATVKKNRLEPAHGLALHIKREESVLWYDMESEGEEVLRYLKGETITVSPDRQNCSLGKKGWVLMTVDGYPIGWAKLAAGILKNHYPKGLRLSI